MPDSPLHRWAKAHSERGVTRFFGRMFDDHPDVHMKNAVVDATGPGRRVRLAGRWVVNFGSDSFLGLDQDSRLIEATERGLARWGTHNGTSRAFAEVKSNVDAERKIARWMRTETALIYPSVTLANLGAIPALVARGDVAVADRYAHASMRDGIRLAVGRGARADQFAHNDPDDLARTLDRLRPYRFALVCVDGVYSMSGTLAALADLRRVCESRDAVLYVDDAHGTGVLGERGRGTVLETLGDYDNTVVVGSLSKAVSAFGGFVAAPAAVQWVLKTRSNPLIFGGPVPPAYLDAVCAAVDILDSPEYAKLRGELDANRERFVQGCDRLGIPISGGLSPILSVPIGNERDTLHAGRFLFDRGFYVQSVIFPAVPHGAGLLRVQVNANHDFESIDGLLDALADLPRSVLEQNGVSYHAVEG